MSVYELRLRAVYYQHRAAYEASTYADPFPDFWRWCYAYATVGMREAR